VGDGLCELECVWIIVNPCVCGDDGVGLTVFVLGRWFCLNPVCIVMNPCGCR
jgi:hypothetical protein